MKRVVAFWILFALTWGIYIAMMVWTLGPIAQDAGSPAFDMRPSGYTPAEAREFLSALGAEARALYLGPQRILDAFYPLCLAVMLIWSLRWALQGQMRGLLRITAVVALVGMLADYAENSLVAGFLHSDPALIADQDITRASLVSQVKAGALSLVASVLLMVLLLRLFAGVKRRRTKR